MPLALMMLLAMDGVGGVGVGLRGTCGVGVDGIAVAMVLALVLAALIVVALLAFMVLALMMFVVVPTVLRRWPPTKAEQRVNATNKPSCRWANRAPMGGGERGARPMLDQKQSRASPAPQPDPSLRRLQFVLGLLETTRRDAR